MYQYLIAYIWELNQASNVDRVAGPVDLLLHGLCTPCSVHSTFYVWVPCVPLFSRDIHNMYCDGKQLHILYSAFTPDKS